MEQILVIIADGAMRKTVREMLRDEFALTFADSMDEGARILDERRTEIAAAMLEVKLAKQYSLSALGRMRGSTLFEKIPLIGVSLETYADSDREYAERGFYDVITLKSPAWLTKKRVRNAIRTRDSLTYTEMERMLRALPINLFLKDTEGRYVFNTQLWHHFQGSEELGWTVRGKTDLEARNNRENAMRAVQSDRAILDSGKSDKYIIKETRDGREEYLELIKAPTVDENRSITGIIGLISDVTERYLLRQELERRSRTDPLTGLLNKGASEELMRQMLREAGEKGTLCALLMIDADNFKDINDRFGHATGDQVLTAVGRVLRDSSRTTDVAGRVGGDEFMMMLRNIPSAETAQSIAGRVGKKIALAFENDPVADYVSVSIGIAMFPAHGADYESLYQAADEALYEVKRQGKNGVRLYGSQE